jgi:DNA-binding IclR family transcriptional regulator
MTEPEPVGKSAVPAVERAVRLLDALAASSEPMGLAQLARQLDLPKSSVLAICSTLASRSMVERCGDGRYKLGLHVVDLSNAYLSATDLVRAFSDVGSQVPLLAQETLVLSVLDGGDAVILARRHGVGGVVWYQVGARFPAHCTATGKAQLSTLAPDVAERLSVPPLAQMTPKGINDPVKLRADLAATRKRGFAIDNEESRIGLVCLGSAVFDASGHSVGGVAVALEKARSRQGERAAMAEAVMQLADLISRQLGHRSARTGALQPGDATA